jgi:hypothetical protein
MASTSTRERCGAPVEVLFYPDVPCNRFEGHAGDHAAAPLPDEDEPAVTTTLPASGSGVVSSSLVEADLNGGDGA